MAHAAADTTSPPPPQFAAEPQIDRLARGVVERRLGVPALFFLEAHLPFVTIFHTLALFLEPIAIPFFGAERIHGFRSLLSDRRKIERLLERIEQLMQEQR